MKRLNEFETTILLDIKKYKIIKVYSFILIVISIVLYILSFIIKSYFVLFLILALLSSLVFVPLVISFAKITKSMIEGKLVVSVNKFINENYEDAHFDKFKTVDLQLLDELNLVNKLPKIKGSGLIEGAYSNIKFSSSNLIVTSTNNLNPFLPLEGFKGQWFIFELLSNSFEEVVILDKNIGLENDLSLLNINNEDFNLIFNVYTSNVIFAKKLLSNDILNIILSHYNKKDGKIYIVLQNNKLHLGFDNKLETLKINYQKRVDETTINTFINDLKVVSKIINTLKLNEIDFSKTKEK